MGGIKLSASKALMMVIVLLSLLEWKFSEALNAAQEAAANKCEKGDESCYAKAVKLNSPPAPGKEPKKEGATGGGPGSETVMVKGVTHKVQILAAVLVLYFC